jgi:hypothetical protein
MALTPSSVKRSTDASGDDILTLTTPAGQQVQGVALIDDAGAQVGVPGNPLPVAGSVAVSNLPATQPVSGTVEVSNLPATQPVSGSVEVSNLPATQPVSGTVSIAANPLPVADAAVLAALGGYGVNDLAEAGALTYVGKESPAGAWLLQRIDATSGLVVRYASVANNASVATYAAAWAGRAGLTYGTFGEAL